MGKTVNWRLAGGQAKGTSHEEKRQWPCRKYVNGRGHGQVRYRVGVGPLRYDYEERTALLCAWPARKRARFGQAAAASAE